MMSPPPFVAKRVSRTRVQTYSAPPAVVFPLHGPWEERRWAVGWEPELIHAGGPTEPRGAIFVTRHGGAEAIWINTAWDAETGHVAYVHVSAGRDVTEIGIRVSGPVQGPSRVEVTYTWTALSPAGNDFVDAQTPEDFDRWMNEWEEEMAWYLRTGKKLERPAEPA